MVVVGVPPSPTMEDAVNCAYRDPFTYFGVALNRDSYSLAIWSMHGVPRGRFSHKSHSYEVGGAELDLSAMSTS